MFVHRLSCQHHWTKLLLCPLVRVSRLCRPCRFASRLDDPWILPSTPPAAAAALASTWRGRRGRSLTHCLRRTCHTLLGTTPPLKLRCAHSRRAVPNHSTSRWCQRTLRKRWWYFPRRSAADAVRRPSHSSPLARNHSCDHQHGRADTPPGMRRS